MMDGLDKVKKILIVMLVVLMGLNIYAHWHTATHHDFQMETVKTGDVTWACLKDRGTYIGCNTVEEYQ